MTTTHTARTVECPTCGTSQPAVSWPESAREREPVALTHYCPNRDCANPVFTAYER